MQHSFRTKMASKLDLTLINDVMTGQLDLVNFKGAVNSQLMADIADRFWQHPDLALRDDKVPANIIGTNSFLKTAKQYFDDVTGVQQKLALLFDDIENPMDTLFDKMRGGLKAQPVVVEPSRQDNINAPACRVMSWLDQESYALQPHDDIAQIENMKSQNTQLLGALNNTITAFNFYLEVPKKGGELRVWHWQPTTDERKALDLAHSGYGYSNEVLSQFDYTDISLDAGDLCVFNGSFVHGVLNANGTGRRTIITNFMSYLEQDRIIYWT